MLVSHMVKHTAPDFLKHIDSDYIRQWNNKTGMNNLDIVMGVIQCAVLLRQAVRQNLWNINCSESTLCLDSVYSISHHILATLYVLAHSAWPGICTLCLLVSQIQVEHIFQINISVCADVTISD